MVEEGKGWNSYICYCHQFNGNWTQWITFFYYENLVNRWFLGGWISFCSFGVILLDTTFMLSSFDKDDEGLGWVWIFHKNKKIGWVWYKLNKSSHITRFTIEWLNFISMDFFFAFFFFFFWENNAIVMGCDYPWKWYFHSVGLFLLELT